MNVDAQDHRGDHDDDADCDEQPTPELAVTQEQQCNADQNGDHNGAVGDIESADAEDRAHPPGAGDHKILEDHIHACAKEQQTAEEAQQLVAFPLVRGAAGFHFLIQLADVGFRFGFVVCFFHFHHLSWFAPCTFIIAQCRISVNYCIFSGSVL